MFTSQMLRTDLFLILVQKDVPYKLYMDHMTKNRYHFRRLTVRKEGYVVLWERIRKFKEIVDTEVRNREAKSIFLKEIFNRLKEFDEDICYDIQRQIGRGTSSVDMFDALERPLNVLLMEEFVVFEKTDNYKRYQRELQKAPQKRITVSRTRSEDSSGDEKSTYDGLSSWKWPSTDSSPVTSPQLPSFPVHNRDNRSQSMLSPSNLEFPSVFNGSKSLDSDTPFNFGSNTSSPGSIDSPLESPRQKSRERSPEPNFRDNMLRMERRGSIAGIQKPNFQRRQSISLAKSVSKVVSEELEEKFRHKPNPFDEE